MAPGIIQNERCIYDNPRNTARATRKDATDQQHANRDKPDAKTLIRNEARAQIPEAKTAFPVLFQTPNTATRNNTLKSNCDPPDFQADTNDGLAKRRIANFYHVGAKPVSRSTFADANNKRPASLYHALFEKAYQHCRTLSPKQKFKFKNKLYSLDAAVIDLVTVGADNFRALVQTGFSIILLRLF